MLIGLSALTTCQAIFLLVITLGFGPVLWVLRLCVCAIVGWWKRGCSDDW